LKKKVDSEKYCERKVKRILYKFEKLWNLVYNTIKQCLFNVPFV